MNVEAILHAACTRKLPTSVQSRLVQFYCEHDVVLRSSVVPTGTRGRLLGSVPPAPRERPASEPVTGRSADPVRGDNYSVDRRRRLCAESCSQVDDSSPRSALECPSTSPFLLLKPQFQWGDGSEIDAGVPPSARYWVRNLQFSILAPAQAVFGERRRLPEVRGFAPAAPDQRRDLWL